MKQSRRSLENTPSNPEATVKPPTMMKSHPTLLGEWSITNTMTIMETPPTAATRLRMERIPADRNARFPFNVRPVISADRSVLLAWRGNRLNTTHRKNTFQNRKRDYLKTTKAILVQDIQSATRISATSNPSKQRSRLTPKEYFQTQSHGANKPENKSLQIPLLRTGKANSSPTRNILKIRNWSLHLI